nr:retrovirus-related Pol polyprotein from transposon TNT 1-94 [Tanacetum cinerariifolium]
IIKKETEYAKLWNDWYKKCDECKYDKISYDKAYQDMQQKIKRLQAQLGDLKEFQVLNYARENTHLKATYKNLFDSISVLRVQTETKIASLQNELQCNIYKNAKLRTQLFKKVSDQKDNTKDTIKNTKFAKQPIVETLPKIGKTNALSNLVTSNSVSTPPVSKGMNNDKVIAPGMFRISPDKVSKEAKKVPNTVSASARTKPITVSQPPVINKKNVNSDINGLSSTGVDNTKTRRPQSRSNTKNDRVPSSSKSSRSMNKEIKVEEHHRNLLLSKKNKHISSTCNNIKIDSQDVISKVVCAMCKKCLIFVNHGECLVNYVNGKKSRGRKHKANVLNNETQQKNQPEIKKPKNVGTRESLATPKPRKPRFLLRWSPTGRLFNQDGKLVAPSNSESHVDCSNGENACTSNAMEPKIKWFPNSTSLLGRKKQKSISSTKASSKFEAEITSSSYGFVWTNENCQYQWETVYFGDCRRLLSLYVGTFSKKDHGSSSVSHTPLFLWAEAIATACFTQNRSIIHRRFNKTPYELINGRKSDISFLHVFGALCYPKNDREDIEKLGAKAQQPTEGELDLLFEAMYDNYFGGQPLATVENVLPAQEPQVRQTSLN